MTEEKMISLSDQELMEKLIQHFAPGSDLAIFQDQNGKMLPVRSWKGLTLNEEGEVVEVYWNKLFTAEQKLSFEFLPPKLKHFTAIDCSLVGNIDLEHLPKTLVWFAVGRNKLSGEIRLNMLPQSLKYLHLENNLLSGRVDFQGAPSGLQTVLLHRNRFNAIDLSALPSGLRNLSLNNNDFSGPVILKNLPKMMRMLYLSDNCFSGETDFNHLPKYLQRLDVSNTRLSGTLYATACHDFRAHNSNVQIVESSVTKSGLSDALDMFSVHKESSSTESARPPERSSETAHHGISEAKDETRLPDKVTEIISRAGDATDKSHSDHTSDLVGEVDVSVDARSAEGGDDSILTTKCTPAVDENDSHTQSAHQDVAQTVENVNENSKETATTPPKTPRKAPRQPSKETTQAKKSESRRKAGNGSQGEADSPEDDTEKEEFPINTRVLRSATKRPIEEATVVADHKKQKTIKRK